MKNNLPEGGWFVNNDGSQQFKNTVLKYLNTLVDTTMKGLNGGIYGINIRGQVDYCIPTFVSMFHGCKCLTIDQFIEMSKPIEKKNCDTVDPYPFAHMCWGMDFGYLVGLIIRRSQVRILSAQQTT